MAKKATNPSYATYQSKGSYTKNKKAKIERHLKKHPNDEQSAASLKNVGLYSRKKPNNKLGWINDSIRSKAVYVPALNGKGNSINIRSYDQYVTILETAPGLTHTIALTKENAQALSHL